MKTVGEHAIEILKAAQSKEIDTRTAAMLIMAEIKRRDLEVFKAGAEHAAKKCDLIAQDYSQHFMSELKSHACEYVSVQIRKSANTLKELPKDL